jgi:hypothetical protein
MDVLANTLLAPFVTGMMGSAHCAAMCAAPMGAVLAPPPSPAQGRPAVALPAALAVPQEMAMTLAAQTGRVASYTAGGALAGAAGAALLVLPGAAATSAVQTLLALAAQAILLATGFHLLGHLAALAWLERLVAPVWAHIRPWALRVLPVRSAGAAFVFGALWGWIPCGLSWAMLAMALGSGSMLEGAMTMAAFGFGTLPAMWLASSGLAQWMGGRARSRWRTMAGVIVIGLGLLGMARVGMSERGVAQLLRLCTPWMGVPT